MHKGHILTVIALHSSHVHECHVFISYFTHEVTEGSWFSTKPKVILLIKAKIKYEYQLQNLFLVFPFFPPSFFDPLCLNN